MAKRPENHITGSKAVRHIQDALLPAEWISNEPANDYGLDLLVEVVENNITTGRHFFIQSKGTKDSMNNGYISYSFPNDRISDYSKVNLPVLFVYYSLSDDKFWGRWMNAVWEILSGDQRKQKTIDLVFTPANEIDEDYLRGIGSSISLALTRQVAVDSVFPKNQFVKFQNQIENLGERLMRNDVSFHSPLSPLRISIQYSGVIDDGTAIVQSKGRSVEILTKGVDISYIYLKNLEWTDTPIQAQNIVLSIALFASEISSGAQDFIFRYASAPFVNLVPGELFYSFFNSIKLGMNVDWSNLLRTIQSSNNEEAKIALLFRLFVGNSMGEDKQSYLSYLECCLESEPDVQSRGGVLCYNLANAIRVNDVRRSVELYAKAARCFPNYRGCFCWCQEFAGALFLTNHYMFAEWFYKKARSLDPDGCRDDIALLIADCLIWQGKFEEAYCEICNQINLEKGRQGDISASLPLKVFAVDKLANESGLKVLRPVVFYNIGVSAQNKGDFQTAYKYFLYTWLFDENDVESLVHAFINAYNAQADTMSLMIFQTMKSQYGTIAYNKLVEILRECNLSIDYESVLNTLGEFFEKKVI